MALSTGSNKIKAAVFISGTGSNLKSLIQFSKLKKSPIVIEMIISNNAKSKGLQYANIYKIKKGVFDFKNSLSEKKIQIEKSEAEKFYKVHETKPFYNDLCAYLSSGPIVVMILEKDNAVLGNRELMGATNPEDADEGTIRKKYGISIDKNSVHGSDSVENAKIEIDFFFKD